MLVSAYEFRVYVTNVSAVRFLWLTAENEVLCGLGVLGRL